MAQVSVLTAVVKEQAPSTAVRVLFSDGTEYVFASLDSLAQWARQADNDLPLTRQMNVAYALARSADLSNIAAVKDKSFVFDLTNNSPIRVQ